MGHVQLAEVTFPDAAMSLLQILLNADGITMARENLQKATRQKRSLFQETLYRKNMKKCRSLPKIRAWPPAWPSLCFDCKAHPAAGIIFVAYYAIAVLVVVNLVTALDAEFFHTACHYVSIDVALLHFFTNFANHGMSQSRPCSRLMIEFYRASLAENVERCEARRSELTRQVQAHQVQPTSQCAFQIHY